MAAPGLQAIAGSFCFWGNEVSCLLVILSTLQATEGTETVFGAGAPATGFHKRVWDAALLMAKLKLLHIQVTSSHKVLTRPAQQETCQPA